jgi:cytochrome c oxidase subunit II
MSLGSWRARGALLARLGGTGAAGVLLAACTSPTSILETASAEARSLAELWWLLLAITLIPAIVYIAVALLAALRRRPAPEAVEGASEAGPDDASRVPPSAAATREVHRVLVIAGALIPTVIVVAALVATLHVGASVADVEPDPALTIDVVGHQYWWRVVYPDHGIESANEIHVPVGAAVRFRLTSADVIHSFWVPRLFGKRDMTPGHISEIVVRVDEPGVYRGQCYEFCGLQHALMGFELVAHPPGEMERWLEANGAAAVRPTDPLAERGLAVFRAAECGHCHAVRGVSEPGASGAPGPDLTHFASRRMLAAATVPNHRGHLAGWLLDPQALKPGNLMPASILAPDELHALLYFLEGLR